jgi:ABC-type glycerol-3-phosphate transport system substrate-binding protein
MIHAAGPARATRMLLSVLVALGACGTGDTRTVRLWAMGREGELVTQLMPAFERAHPGVRVEVQQLPWSSAHEKLLTALSGRRTTSPGSGRPTRSKACSTACRGTWTRG